MIIHDKEVDSYLSSPSNPESFSESIGGTSLFGSASSADPSLLDHQETSVHDNWESPYRAFLIRGMIRAVNKAELLYRLTDLRDGRNLVDNFRSCRSAAWFVRHEDTGQVRVASKRCGLRWCPLCINTKRFIITNQVTGWLKDLDRPKFMTLTLRHSSDHLSDQIDRLYRCFRNLRRWPVWKKKVRGGVWFFQVKKSAVDGLWHPHLHMLLDCSYFSQSLLSDMWLTVTGDSDIVDIRPVTDPKKAAAYVARYSSAPCKLVDLDSADCIELFDAMNGRRLIGKFGSAGDLVFTPKKPDDWHKWIDLHGFGYVQSHKDSCPVAAEIWRAWKYHYSCTYEPPWKHQRDVFKHDQDQAEPEPAPELLLFY